MSTCLIVLAPNWIQLLPHFLHLMVFPGFNNRIYWNRDLQFSTGNKEKKWFAFLDSFLSKTQKALFVFCLLEWSREAAEEKCPNVTG